MNSIIKRNQSEKRFKFYGILAVATAIFLLMILLFKIFSTGITAFNQTYIGVKIQIEANSDVSNLDPRRELKRNLRVMFPDAKGLFFVLCIFLSVSLSKIWFKAADEAAKNANPSKLARPEMTSL